MMNQDTICAIATAQGGAIGSIRVSGPEAISITSLIFKPAKPDKLFSDQKPYSLTFGRIYDGDEIIDEVLVSLFRTPHSYTGEDSTEITCHGSSYILQQVLQLLIKKGCRMAQPGEYTQRAFLNGKMDLSQAEAVADLIASSSAATHRLAMSQMRGGFSKELTDLRNKLLNFTSMIELELDFSEEDVEFADRSALKKLADEIEQVISRLVQSFNVGNAIKSGVPVAIIGETNAGKSTLLNVLLNEDKAIVSDIHGTCILAIRDDDDRAYMTRLFVKYQRLMYRTIYDILGDKWATEDVLQTTLLRLIDHLDTLRRLEPEGLAGYIAAACRHTAYNAVRDSGRHPWLPLDGEPEVPDERQEVEDRVLRRLELDALAQVWPRLDENTRWLLEARYILDYSDGELARELGVKPDSVRMALTRARRKARRLMESQHNEQNV